MATGVTSILVFPKSGTFIYNVSLFPPLLAYMQPTRTLTTIAQSVYVGPLKRLLLGPLRDNAT